MEYLPNGGDLSGRLFYEDGDLFRGIYPEYADFYQAFISSAAYQDALRVGLIDFKPLSDNPYQEDFPLVLKVYKVCHVTYPSEWTGEMLLEAAHLTVKLDSILRKHGYALMDAHPWNVLFMRGSPVFIDLGSIRRLEEINARSVFEEFLTSFCYPLLLHQRHYHDLKVAHLLSCGVLLKYNQMIRLCISLKQRRRLIQLIALKRGVKKGRHYHDGLDSLFGPFLASLNLSSVKTEWSNYKSLRTRYSAGDDELDSRISCVLNFIASRKPKSLLDIGASDGFVSEYAARQGAQVVAVERDEVCLEKLREITKEKNLEISCVAMDVRHMTPAHGLMGGYAPFEHRSRCEVVVALAVIHHLVLRFKCDLDALIDKFIDLTDKDLILEFIPYDDPHVAGWDVKRNDAYSQKYIKRKLDKLFKVVDALPSIPEPRVLFICSGKLD